MLRTRNEAHEVKTAKFKDSELGPIPEDWEVKRLGDVCSLITKGTTPTSIGCQFVQNGITFVKAESISESGKIIKGMLAHIDAQTHRLLNRSILQEGDLLFSIAGVLGRVGRINNDILPANTNQALAIIRIGDDGNINRDYLFYCLKAQYVDDAIRNFSVGVAQANLSLEQVGRLQLAFPPLPEQRRIAEALGAVDRLIDSLDELIAKKRRIAQGFAHDLLGMRNVNSDYSDKPANAGKMKDTRTLVSASDKSEFQKSGERNEPIRRLPGFTGEWVRKRLGEIGVILKGSGICRAESNTGNIPAIRYGEIYTSSISSESTTGIFTPIILMEIRSIIHRYFIYQNFFIIITFRYIFRKIINKMNITFY